MKFELATERLIQIYDGHSTVESLFAFQQRNSAYLNKLNLYRIIVNFNGYEKSWVDEPLYENFQTHLMSHSLLRRREQCDGFLNALKDGTIAADLDGAEHAYKANMKRFLFLLDSERMFAWNEADVGKYVDKSTRKYMFRDPVTEAASPSAASENVEAIIRVTDVAYRLTYLQRVRKERLLKRWMERSFMILFCQRFGAAAG